MAVVIDSGRPEATDPLGQWPVERWGELAHARRFYMVSTMSADCRDLVRFAADAETMFKPLGYASPDDFMRRGLELDPDDAAIAVAWLKKNNPDEPIPYPVAVQLGSQERGVPGGKPGPGRGHKTGDNVTRFKRGNSSMYTLARLERDGFADLAAQVRSGDKSAHAAAIEAGFRRKPTPLGQILKLIPKLSPDDVRVVAAALAQASADLGVNTQ
jgi:hypothetical protein